MSIEEVVICALGCGTRPAAEYIGHIARVAKHYKENFDVRIIATGGETNQQSNPGISEASAIAMALSREHAVHCSIIEREPDGEHVLTIQGAIRCVRMMLRGEKMEIGEARALDTRCNKLKIVFVCASDEYLDQVRIHARSGVGLWFEWDVIPLGMTPGSSAANYRARHWLKSLVRGAFAILCEWMPGVTEMHEEYRKKKCLTL